MFSWKHGLVLFIFNVVFKHPFSEDLFMVSFKSFIVLDLKAFSPLIQFELVFVCSLGSFFLTFPFSPLSALLFPLFSGYSVVAYERLFLSLALTLFRIQFMKTLFYLLCLFCSLSSVRHYLYPCASMA